MHLAFDIFQGIGVAAAVGIRPFLPALAVGGLAAGDVEIHFKATDYSFLQGVPFLLGMVAGVILIVLVERRYADRLERRPGVFVLAAIAMALGALLFAGSLARGHYTAWPGLIGGVLCAAIGTAAKTSTAQCWAKYTVPSAINKNHGTETNRVFLLYNAQK